MTLRMFTLVFSDEYLALMERGLMKSLAWPANRAALDGAEWHIFTTEPMKDRVTAVSEKLGVPVVLNIMQEAWAGQFLANAIKHHMIVTAQAGDTMLVCPPDTIFGEGSIPSLIEIGCGNKLAISIAHVRVNETFMEEFTGEKMSSAQLVSMSLKHLHQTWREANLTKKYTNTFVGGASWKEIGPNLYAVTHLLPTPYFINPHPSDAEWFRRYGNAGAFDHLWPSKLVDEGRHRFVGSSDAAFAVEITKENENLPILYPIDPNDPTNYIGSNKHNHINRNTVAIFRGE